MKILHAEVIKFMQQNGVKGGKVKSEKKAAACRINGKKGGRPISDFKKGKK